MSAVSSESKATTGFLCTQEYIMECCVHKSTRHILLWGLWKHFFIKKDEEIVYISQSDLGIFQLIFKDDNSTNNA